MAAATTTVPNKAKRRLPANFDSPDYDPNDDDLSRPLNDTSKSSGGSCCTVSDVVSAITFCLSAIAKGLAQGMFWLVVALIITVSIDAVVDERRIIQIDPSSEPVEGRPYASLQDCESCVGNNDLSGDPAVYNLWCWGASDPTIFPEEKDPSTAPPRCWDALRYYYDESGVFHSSGIGHDQESPFSIESMRLARNGVTTRRCPYQSLNTWSCKWYRWFTWCKGPFVSMLLSATVQPITYDVVIPVGQVTAAVARPVISILGHLFIVPSTLIGAGFVVLCAVVFLTIDIRSSKLPAWKVKAKRALGGRVLRYRYIFHFAIPCILGNLCIYLCACRWFGVASWAPRHLLGFRTDGRVTSERAPLPGGIAVWGVWDVIDWLFIVVVFNAVFYGYMSLSQWSYNKNRTKQIKEMREQFEDENQDSSTTTTDVVGVAKAVVSGAAMIGRVVETAGAVKSVVDTVRA